MAIAPTGAIYKSLIFDGEYSRTYGVYITGEAVYNAPERDVEMITIAGRSGSFALDNGRFENITVTYPAGIFADNETDFAQAISDFRNFLCSKQGYCRLEDEYNPNEYRMAIYKSGLEVDTAQMRAGEFNITFECKPQRWLTSGETAVTVANNGTLTNPTLFESSPLLQVWGDGTLVVNGYEVELESVVLGEIILQDSTQAYQTKTFTIPQGNVNNGDTITVNISSIGGTVILTKTAASFNGSTTASSSDSSASFLTTTYRTADTSSKVSIQYQTRVDDIVITAGTDKTTTNTLTITVSKAVSGVTVTGTFTITQRVVYTASAGTIDFSVSVSKVVSDPSKAVADYLAPIIKIESIKANSTVSALGSPTYIDCDLGEAYMIENGSMVSLNQYIDLGSDLPVLASGTNTFTMDNTITELKVTPRWWKV